MHKNLLIAVGITILFLGLAIQPSIAVNPISSDNEEACNLCAKKVSKTQIVVLKSLINRVETLNNKLSVVSKHNPEVAEEYQELLSYNYENDNTNGWFFGKIPLCLFLVFMMYLAMMFSFLINDFELLDFLMDVYYNEYNCDESLFE